MKNVFYLIQSLLDSRFLVQSTELGHLIYTTDVNEALAWESALEAKAVERFIRASDPVSPRSASSVSPS